MGPCDGGDARRLATIRSATTVGGMFGEQPFESLVGRRLCSDTLIHTWDLAWATGQDESLDEDAATKALEFLTSSTGPFGDPGASPQRSSPPDSRRTNTSAQLRGLCRLTPGTSAIRRGSPDIRPARDPSAGVSCGRVVEVVTLVEIVDQPGGGLPPQHLGVSVLEAGLSAPMSGLGIRSGLQRLQEG